MKELDIMKNITPDGLYKADIYGSIYSFRKGKPREVKQYWDGNTYRVHIGNQIPIASRVIWETFNGEIPKRYCIIHKNGNKSDNCLANLKMVAITEIARNPSKRKPVAKVNENGEIIEFYSSIEEAAKVNFVSYNAVLRRCKNLINNPFKRLEFDFMYA